jgi:hypothetical protein
MEQKIELQNIYDEIFKFDNTNFHVSTHSTTSLININPNLIKSSIMELFDAEYVIFPTNHLYHMITRIFYNPIKYLQKTKIVCINYYLRYEILHILKKINNIIKSEDKKYEEVKERLLNLIKKDKLKCIYFMDNTIEPDTLYRKIKFSTEELFLSFDKFAFKRIEYKLKTMCQIAEKMGALKIDIDYVKDENMSSIVEAGLTGVQNEASIKNKRLFHTKINLKMNHVYNKSNQISNVNLNIEEIYKMIDKENDFYIAKEEFLSDIDLKFLINSRCVNLVDKYKTTLIFEYANAFEKQIIQKVRGFGLNLNVSFDEKKTESLEIDIEFLKLFDYITAINGENISPYKSGFNQLAKIIEKSKLITEHNNLKKKLNQELSKFNIELNQLELLDSKKISIKDENRKIFLQQKIMDISEELDLLDVNNCIEKENEKEKENENNLIEPITRTGSFASGENRENMLLTQTINTQQLKRDILVKPNTKLYGMIKIFLESHLKMLNKNKKLLFEEINFYVNSDLVKMYEHVLTFNFSNKELDTLFLHFFENNLSYNTFEQFRNLLIKPNINFYDYFGIENYFNLSYKNDILKPKCFFDYCKEQKVNRENNLYYYVDKFIYTTHQYHIISEFKNQILDIVKESLDKIKIKLLKKCEEHQHFFISSTEIFLKIFKKLHLLLNVGVRNEMKIINKLYKKYGIKIKKRKVRNFIFSEKYYYDPKTYYFIYLMNLFKNEHKVKGNLNSQQKKHFNLVSTLNFMENDKTNVGIDEKFTCENIYSFIKKIMQISYLNVYDNQINKNNFKMILEQHKLIKINNTFKLKEMPLYLNCNMQIVNEVSVLTFINYFFKKFNFCENYVFGYDKNNDHICDHLNKLCIYFKKNINENKNIVLFNNLSMRQREIFIHAIENCVTELSNKKTSLNNNFNLTDMDVFNVENNKQCSINIPLLCNNNCCNSDNNLNNIVKNILNDKINSDIDDIIAEKNDENNIFFDFDTDNEDFLLTCLCFLIENNKFTCDDLNEQTEVANNRYKKLKSEINNYFDILKDDIINLFNRLFFTDDGFFYMTNKDVSKEQLIVKLIEYYKRMKVNPDKKIIILIKLIFENNNIDIDTLKKLFSEKRFMDKIFEHINEITKHYSIYNKNSSSEIFLYDKNKKMHMPDILSNYKKHKIFVTFEEYIEKITLAQQEYNIATKVIKRFFDLIKEKKGNKSNTLTKLNKLKSFNKISSFALSNSKKNDVNRSKQNMHETISEGKELEIKSSFNNNIDSDDNFEIESNLNLKKKQNTLKI